MAAPPTDGRYLTPLEARRVYDRIGRFQDWQAFYEGPAVRELIHLGGFHSAKSVLEFGCGTGAFAARLMKIVPKDCRYVGIDLSPIMTRLATSRLTNWTGRATVILSNGSANLPEADGAFDYFVSNYVIDLLAREYATAVLAEAQRVLCVGGKLCLVSLGRGTSGLSRTVTGLWETVWKYKPQWVGGCCPSELTTLLKPNQWSIDHHSKVVSFGITSEVVVASRRQG